MEEKEEMGSGAGGGEKEQLWSSFEPTPEDPRPKDIAEEFLRYKIGSLERLKEQLQLEKERAAAAAVDEGGSQASVKTKTNTKPQSTNVEELERKIAAARRTRVIFAAVGGSVAYGLAEAHSDVDFIGVYLYNTKDLLSLFPSRHNTSPGASASSSNSSVMELLANSNVTPLSLSLSNTPCEPPPDINLYEAKKFCELLIQGNPFAIEALYIGSGQEDGGEGVENPIDGSRSSKLWYASKEFVELRKRRRSFLTSVAVREYLNYVKGQLRKDLDMQVRKRDPKPRPGKRIYHCVRLLNECRRIAVRNDEPRVRVPEDEGERSYLVSVRKEMVDRTEFHAYAQQLIQEIEAQEPWPHLPSAVDASWLNRWLVDLRRSLIDSSEAI